MIKVFKNATDISLNVESYVDDYSFGTLLDSDFIYVGFDKPINALYVHMTTANTNTSVLSLEYYNGAFIAAVGLVDRTVGLSGSNFIEWDRNQTEEVVTTINGLEKFWYRISVDVTTSALTFRGINLLFSSDEQLREEANYLLSTDYYVGSETSFVNYHQAARNQIIQRLRNEGYRVINNSTGHKDLDIFDLLDYKQLQEASKYLVLAKIFFFLSDATDDKYNQKHIEFTKMYSDAFRTFFLAVDLNDDGKESVSEKGQFKSGIIIRV